MLVIRDLTATAVEKNSFTLHYSVRIPETLITGDNDDGDDNE